MKQDFSLYVGKIRIILSVGYIAWIRIVYFLNMLTFHPTENPKQAISQFMSVCLSLTLAEVQCFCARFTGKRVHSLRSNFILRSIRI